jgi:SMI1 / KNR4 family (SUKH-1)
MSIPVWNGEQEMSDRFAELRKRLPVSYVNFIDSHDGWEGDLGDKLGYVNIWNRESIQEQWDGCKMALYLSDRWFPFGSDGGGEMLCFDLSSGSDNVIWISYVGMSDEDAMAQPFTFADLANEIRTNSHSP